MKPGDRPLLEQIADLTQPGEIALRWIRKGGHARDVTDMRFAEERASDSDERLGLALEGAQMIVFDWDFASGEVVCVGDHAQAFGVEEAPEDLAGLFELIHPDDRERVRAAIGEPIADGPRSAEVRIGAAGAWRWALVHGVVVRDESGQPRRLVGTALDVTERKEAEESLGETKDALHAVVASAPVAITIVDRQHRISMWNPAAERMFGWSEAEVVNGLAPQIPRELEDETRALRVRALAGEAIATFETQRIRKDGARIDVSLALTPNRSAGGEIIGVIGILVDISAQVAARRHLQETVCHLEEIDGQRGTLLRRLVGAQEEERRRLAGDIHDDSIQALTALVLRLGLLYGSIDDEEQREFLVNAERTARNAISRLRHLIFDLRPPALERDGLAAALRLLLDDLRDSTGIEYTLEDRLTDEPPDELRSIIYRIAQEALTNVRKHADARTVSVSLANGEGGVLVRVEDDGRGLRPGAAAHPEPGHIGLSTMRERAETAGGSWQIVTKPGQGTAIEFSVPCEEAA